MLSEIWYTHDTTGSPNRIADGEAAAAAFGAKLGAEKTIYQEI